MKGVGARKERSLLRGGLSREGSLQSGTTVFVSKGQVNVYCSAE